MFSAYFDDSGKASQGTLVSVGGAVSTVEKWETLSERWQAELSKRGLKLLHMKELFRHIKGTEAERLMEALSLLVKAHTNKTFAYCISLRGWKSVNRRYMLSEELGQPAALAGFACLGQLKKWAQKNGKPIDRIQVIFEHGSDNAGFMVKRCKREFGVDIAFAGKTVVPLQVADFIAWQARRHMMDVADKKGFIERSSHLMLRSRSSAHQYALREHLERLCVEGNIPARIAS